MAKDDTKSIDDALSFLFDELQIMGRYGEALQMETVEVVIRLPRSEYKELTRGGYTWWGKYGEYIKNGTVLPKGHDNLIDKGQLLRNVRKKAQEYDEPWKTNLGSVVEYFVAGCDVIIGEDWSYTDGNS